MSHSNTINFALALLAAATTVKASISDQGPWTNNDWIESGTGYKYVNGVPESDDAMTNRRIKAPLALAENELSDWETKENVLLVKDFLDEVDFNEFFPLRNAKYTYTDFLKAVAKFPHFCNEFKDENKLNLENEENACKRELAALFAHMAYESGNNDGHDHSTDMYKQGLVHLAEDCEQECDYEVTSGKYPAVEGKEYYGRGPLRIQGNTEYGAFGEAFGPIKYDSKDRFLNDPDAVTSSGYILFASAMWFYMTPSGLKPSMHDVMTNFWEPNSTDSGSNIEQGFGATVAIINGENECGLGHDSWAGATRHQYYQSFLTDFGLHAGEAGLSCAFNWARTFPYSGSQNTKKQYFTSNGWNSMKCKTVQHETQYNIYVEDDYKRCVCDTHADGESSCPMKAGSDEGHNDGDDNDQNDNDQNDQDDQDDNDQDDNDQDDNDQDDNDQDDDDQDDNDQDDDQDDNDQDDNDQDDNDQDDNDQDDDDQDDQDDNDQDDNDQDDDDQNDDDQDDDDDNGDDDNNDNELDLDNEVSEMFRLIWENMHYDVDEGDLSRTLWQVDQSLDYIEDILISFEQTMQANGLIQN